MPFSDADYQGILSGKGNKSLRRKPEDKYAQYREKDPFPEIGDALLNSVDIVKYCAATGMIEPFDIKEVSGVTYTCHFSGKYYYWDGTSDNLVRKTEADDPELILRPNSIAYLEIDEMFRVPDYLIIRYNLQVTHVYKGLLLGTGPIVDPGFVGHLYIPLHNLTSNEYQIKKGTPLITLEFTKIGRNKGTGPDNAWPRAAKNSLDFTALRHQPRRITPERKFNYYLHNALFGNELFKTTKDNLSVGSSIPEKIRSAQASAQAAEKSATRTEKSFKRAKNFLFGIGLVGIFSFLIAIVGFMNDVNGRIDNVLTNSNSISTENHHLQEQNDQLTEKNHRLRKENADLKAIIDELTPDETDTSAEPVPSKR